MSKKKISFRTFKEHCANLDIDYDFHKHQCVHDAYGGFEWGHEHREFKTKDPQTGKKYYYAPCKEKYCPWF